MWKEICQVTYRFYLVQTLNLELNPIQHFDVSGVIDLKTLWDGIWSSQLSVVIRGRLTVRKLDPEHFSRITVQQKCL